jgi:FAD/FMN-containing dehydrogenase
MAIARPLERAAPERSIAALRARLQGQLIVPGDMQYEAARAVWNGAADRRPVLIVRCADALDVAAAIAFARMHELQVAVRSGGHSIAGHSTCDGVLIDLSLLCGIEIDPARRIARIEPGLTWGEVANALQPHGLAITSGDTATVGVGGLTLGGGIGWMVRKHGLAIDNLRAVELVTADGRLLRVSPDEHADLFWGLRGGGGNFGVAIAFEFDLHPGGIVLAGAVFYDARDRGQTEAIMRSYARLAAAAPDELTTQALLMVAPSAPFIPPQWHGAPVVAIAACYTGDVAEGERAVAPLRGLAHPIADVLGPMPYAAIFALTAAGEERGLEHQVRSCFLERLEEPALRALVAEAAATMSPETLVQVRVLGGAMGRVPPEATAFAHRDKEILFMVTNYGPPGAGTAARRERSERLWRAIRPHARGVYANFLGVEGVERIQEAYPSATHARLAALKARYDPHNLFRHNQNIAPASPAE